MGDQHVKGIAACPYCQRTVRTFDRVYALHSTSHHNGDKCPLSRRRMPITGHRDVDYDARAFLVASLACEVQDRDIAEPWAYLGVLPPAELRRLLVIALAAVPTDKTVDQIWDWVNQLPAAKEALA